MKEVLKALVGRISKKAVLLTIAMILVYMVVSTPGAVSVIIAIITISGLAILGSILQFYLDNKNRKNKEKSD